MIAAPIASAALALLIAATPTAAPRAPSRPPLAPSGAGTGAVSGVEEGGEASAAGETDPLVSNGLGSPSCKGALAGELSAADRGHCETSGFIAAPAPTGDYGIDVHIDSGVLGFSASAAVQDLLITPLWMVLVWSTHALIVMLEWAFTVDLLDSTAAGGLARGLRQAQAALTDPWLPLALAVASMLALYHGLIRRRVAATLGEALLMGVMMAGGAWVIADPTGTVGALGQWANQAALGTLAVAARGTPSAPGKALGVSLDTVFAAAIEAPWCYLEFGAVSWCRDPARLDPALRRAGLAIAERQDALAHCRLAQCVAAGGSAQALEHSAQLLRDARSNGAVFLALPANGPARNSINEAGSLLRAICQSSETGACRGPTAAQAEFRTAGQTIARLAGLLLIAAGLLGMLLLLGFVAVRLLTAAIFSLLYLLLAPAMVLAPAFGEGGRTLFRRWVAQLLGAVVSKLLFSFLLGVVLAVLTILSDLSAIGWWTQWLLMSAFWWSAYLRRHHALSLFGGAVSRDSAQHRSVLRRVGDVLETRKAHTAGRWWKKRRDGSAPSIETHRTPDQAGSGRASGAKRGGEADVHGQAMRTLAVAHGDASARVASAEDSELRMSALRGRLERIRLEHAKASASGDWRREIGLERRSQRIEGDIERERATLRAARPVAGRSREEHRRERHAAQERFLDAQAALPASAARLNRRADAGAPVGARRDYPRLAGLAGYTPEEYERLDPAPQRVTRLAIDRDLALRGELRKVVGGSGHSSSAVEPPPRQLSGRREDSDRPGSGAREEIDPALLRQARESSVMRDAREVAAGRKRQLGRDRP